MPHQKQPNVHFSMLSTKAHLSKKSVLLLLLLQVDQLQTDLRYPNEEQIKIYRFGMKLRL